MKSLEHFWLTRAFSKEELKSGEDVCANEQHHPGQALGWVLAEFQETVAWPGRRLLVCGASASLHPRDRSGSDHLDHLEGRGPLRQLASWRWRWRWRETQSQTIGCSHSGDEPQVQVSGRTSFRKLVWRVSARGTLEEKALPPEHTADSGKPRGEMG